MSNYEFPASSTGSSYEGGAVNYAPPKKKGSFVGNLVGDPYRALVGFGPALYHTGAAFYHDVGAVAHGNRPTSVYRTVIEPLGQDPFVKDIRAAFSHPLRSSSIYNYLTGGKQPQSEVVKQISEGHVFIPALDALAIVSAGGARIGALGQVSERAPGVTAGEATRRALVRGQHSGPLQTITVRDTQFGGEVPTRTLPRNVYQAGRMKATDKALKRLVSSTAPLLGEQARAARAITRESQPTLLRHLADQRFDTYRRAFSKLTQNERVALGALARVPLQEDLAGWKRILAEDGGPAAQRMLDTLSDPKMLTLYNAPGASKRLGRAHDAAVALVRARENILFRTEALTPEAAAAAVYAPSRVARGATFGVPVSAVTEDTPIGATVRVAGKKTEGKLVSFVDGDALVFYPRFNRTATIPLAKLEAPGMETIGGAPITRPRTVEEAQARLDELEKERDRTIEDVRKGLFGPAVRADVARRNVKRGKAIKQQARINKSLRSRGFGETKLKLERTVLEEQRAEAIRVIESYAETSTNPTLRAWKQRGDEIAALHEALNPELFEKVDVSKLGTVTEGLSAVEQRRVKPSLMGGGTPEEIAAEIAAAGRPQPFYLRDVSATKPRGMGRGGQGGALTPPASDVLGSERVLFRIGQLALHPDVLSTSFLAAARYEYRLEKHEQVKRIATPIAEGAGLPAGMRWVREIRGERIPFTETHLGEHLAELDRALPEEASLTAKEHERNAVVARDAEGRRLAVSERLAHDLEGEFRQTGKVMRWFVQKPLDVWRALVLNLRIPWLVNNIVGNHLLFALRFAGSGGLRAYLDLLSDDVRTKLFRTDATRALTREDQALLFPAQTRGTFIGTQTPNAALGRARRAVGVLGAGLAPLDRRTEQRIRRAATTTVLRGSPEARALYKAMPRQERSMREAMRRAAGENPDLARLADQEANRAIGDYLSLSPTERGAVRRVAPFYGWYREITRIAGHAVVDTPVRVALLARLGILEEERQQDLRGAFPSFLEGSVSLGPGPQGTQDILALRGSNPFSTVADIGQAASLIANYNNRQGAEALTGMLNPYGSAAVSALFRSAQGDPNDPSYLGPAAAALSRLGAPGLLAGQVVGGVPQVQALFPPPPSRFYPTRDRNDILLRLLGDIRRQPSLQQAHLWAEQGR